MPEASQPPRAVPCDYGTDPGRFAASQAFRPGGDVSGLVAGPVIAGTVAGFRDGSFGTVAALWMLNHLPDPALALREAGRLLRPGGCAVTCAPSRFNDPELAPVLPGWGRPLTFDAENTAGRGPVPARLTKRGTLIWARPKVELAPPR